MSSDDTQGLVAQLDSFDAAVRRRALEQLAGRARRRPAPPARAEVNLHCHTFFSFNAYGYSPSRFAWEARRYGLEVAGIVDFDVMDGVQEFLDAGRLLGLKAVAGLETRVFLPEYRERVTNSPHEPGVMYLPVCGLTRPPRAGTPAARTLARMRALARERNLRMVERVNAYLAPVQVDYERDVLPLTPAGNATERHMLEAYERRSREQFAERGALARFWSGKLHEPAERLEGLLDDPPAFKTLVRARLMKHGGVGYAAPEEGSFPTADEVVDMTLACGGVPTIGWVDGTSDGEADPWSHFRFLQDRKRMPWFTIVPDRNWNLDEPAEKALKVGKLREALEAVRELELPVLAGTEMNRHGQRFVDDFSVPELEPYRQVFLDGAHVAWGHTLLRLTAGVGYADAWAERHFGADRAARNEFFGRVGAGPVPPDEVWQALSARGPESSPDELLEALGH